MRILRFGIVAIILASFAVPLLSRDTVQAQTSTELWVYTFGNDNVTIAAIADPDEISGFVWGPTSVAANYTVQIEPGWDEADLDPVITAATAIGKPVRIQIFSAWDSSYANDIITDASVGGAQDIFIASVEAWLAAHAGLDGIELDLESDEQLTSSAEVTAYGAFIEHLYNHLNPGGYNISVNGSWRYPSLPASAAPYLDYYTTGCYDFDGSTGGGATWPWYGTLANIQTVISRYHTTQANGAGGFDYNKLGIGTSLAIYDSGGWTGLGYDYVVANGGTAYLDNAWGSYTYNGLNLMISKAAWAASVGLHSIYLYNWHDYDVPNDPESAVTNSYAALGSPAPPPPTTTATPDIPQPTSTTDQIVSVGAFADLAEADDVSISFHWDLSAYGDNGTYPDTPASLSIIFQLIDTDNTTILSTATPYVYAPFQTNGYGEGVSSFYFNATDNLTWGQAYYIRIVQNPTYFTTPVTQSYTMTGSNWIGDQEDMYDWYIQMCDFLLAEYPTVNLKASTDIGLVFSTYGEAYFRAAVTGIQTLCPQLFYIQDYLPTEMTVTPYNTDLQDQYSARMQASEIKRGADRLMAHFGLEGYFGLGFAVLAACIGAGVYTSKKGWGLEPGLIGASIISVAGAVLIGNAVFTIVMVGSLVAVIALMFTWVGRRA